MKHSWTDWLPLSIRSFVMSLDTVVAHAFEFALVEHGFSRQPPIIHPAYLAFYIHREGTVLTCSIDRRDRFMFFDLSTNFDHPDQRPICLVNVLSQSGADLPETLTFHHFSRGGLRCAAEIVHQVAKAVRSHGQSLLLADPNAVENARKTIEQLRKAAEARDPVTPGEILRRRYLNK